jgi:hypothetical protein
MSIVVMRASFVVVIGIERAEFPLPEGVVRLEFPASLSTASYEDFEAWVELVLRRAKRGVSKRPPTEAASRMLIG